MSFTPANLIKKKRDGQSLTAAEIDFLVTEFYRDQLPEYQMAAFLMAAYFRGFTKLEAGHLTQAMLKSGAQVQFEKTPFLPVDKHSTGGVGDKTSLLIAPIVAACGVPVPMIAGRGLGHTGGTLDKLESIPGFSTQLSLEAFKTQVLSVGCAMIGQTHEICPADKRMYALRDVTATVESLGLICGSILSKKIAEGIRGLVMDVKFGSGAFMKTEAQAQELAEWLIETAHVNGVNVVALLTSMEQPLGRFAGNAIEVLECLAIFKKQSALGFAVNAFDDTRELSLQLSAEMLFLSGAAATPQAGYDLAQQALDSGRAYQKFEEMVRAQGGRLQDFHFSEDLAWDHLLAEEDGYLLSYNTEAIGLAGVALGAGRKKTTDVVDPTASLIIHKKIGDPVRRGERLFSWTAADSQRLREAHQFLTDCYKISLQKLASPSLIVQRLEREGGSH